MRRIPNMPKKFTTWLCFDYKDEEDVEVQVEYSVSGDPEDGYELDLRIIENNTKFTTNELTEYIYNNDEIYSELCGDQGEQIEDFIDGYDDYLAERDDD